ncbi:sulfotransferase [Erythrobacter sp. YT30]|uniref:sulfotransferase n=1 Tax=Erythrobacter sp. YT30 TaxID=1735012 RepID=UPI00076C986C|nr:sulfotransferase [Erythrobacter sp. YT30]KWV90957.1 hypothetical protein AUC45_06385 [Erythrobacter sp. YT30]
MQHLFILCYGRTGSTVVQGLLNRIDGYCIRGERKGVLSGLAKAAVSARREKEEFSPNDIKVGVKSPHYGVSQTSPDRFGKALADLFTREMLTPPEGTRVCGTKDITMSTDWISDAEFDDVIEFIMTRFDDPRIVFLTRRADEVAQSGWWAEISPKSVAENITQTDSRFARAREAYPDRTFLLDYSEFKGTVDGFRRLLEWLGEPVDEAMLEDISSTKLMHLKSHWQQKKSPPPGLLQRAKRKVKLTVKSLIS